MYSVKDDKRQKIAADSHVWEAGISKKQLIWLIFINRVDI